MEANPADDRHHDVGSADSTAVLAAGFEVAGGDGGAAGAGVPVTDGFNAVPCLP
jgi:hypothetical protein